MSDIRALLWDTAHQLRHGMVGLADGTWVVRDPRDGDTWPVAPDIFAKNYEPAFTVFRRTTDYSAKEKAT